jgi:hypothetical protein
MVYECEGERKTFRPVLGEYPNVHMVVLRKPQKKNPGPETMVSCPKSNAIRSRNGHDSAVTCVSHFAVIFYRESLLSSDRVSVCCSLH